MRINWPDDRCIICLGTPRDGAPMSQRSRAHVIPDSIGGKLWSPFLCGQCNNDMGRHESVLAKDVMVLGLVDRLRDRLPPDLAASIYKNTGYFTDTEEFGRIYARPTRAGDLRPIESETIRSDRNVLRQIEAEMRRRGADDAAVGAKISEFADAPDGTSINVLPGFTVVRGIPLSELSWSRTYDEPIVSPVVPLGMAYLYLALCIGGHIYGPALKPTRDTLRQAIGGAQIPEGSCRVESMRSVNAPPEPKYALGVVQEADGVVVKVFVFRELVWEVQFPGVSLRGTAPYYMIDLTTGTETCG